MFSQSHFSPEWKHLDSHGSLKGIAGFVKASFLQSFFKKLNVLSSIEYTSIPWLPPFDHDQKKKYVEKLTRCAR